MWIQIHALKLKYQEVQYEPVLNLETHCLGELALVSAG